jgi:hypothetical protein
MVGNDSPNHRDVSGSTGLPRIERDRFLKKRQHTAPAQQELTILQTKQPNNEQPTQQNRTTQSFKKQGVVVATQFHFPLTPWSFCVSPAPPCWYQHYPQPQHRPKYVVVIARSVPAAVAVAAARAAAARAWE